MKPNSLEDILRRTIVLQSTRCHEWMGYRSKFGYGMVKYRGYNHRVHRIVFQLWWGAVLPNWLGVFHDCPGGDNPACCNPDHLWIGLPADNARDRDAKGRHVAATGTRNGRHTKPECTARGEQCGASKLNELQAIGVLARWLQGASQSAIAREYGVSRGPVQQIIYGHTWKHLFDPPTEIDA